MRIQLIDGSVTLTDLNSSSSHSMISPSSRIRLALQPSALQPFQPLISNLQVIAEIAAKLSLPIAETQSRSAAPKLNASEGLRAELEPDDALLREVSDADFRPMPTTQQEIFLHSTVTSTRAHTCASSFFPEIFASTVSWASTIDLTMNTFSN